MASFTLYLVLLWSIVFHVDAQLIKCNGNCACPTVAPIPGETCILDCGTGEDKCKGKTLRCRAGDPCEIRCDAKATCSDGTNILASSATDVNIICTKEDSCKDGIKIQCGTENCRLECGTGTSCEDFGSIDVSKSESFQCVGGNCPGKVPDNFTPPTPKPTSPTSP